MPQAIEADFRIYQHGALVGLVALSNVAEHWLEENVMGGCALWVERCHVGDLLDVLYREGFRVSVGMTG